jgi:YVTN family beta-propeller protein
MNHPRPAPVVPLLVLGLLLTSCFGAALIAFADGPAAQHRFAGASAPEGKPWRAIAAAATSPAPGPTRAVGWAPLEVRPHPGLPAYGQVAETVDLLNGTLVAGTPARTIDATGAYGVAVDPATGIVFVADSSAGGISAVNVSNGTVSTIPFVEGPTFNSPTSIALDPARGNLFVISRPFLYTTFPGNLTILNLTTGSVRATVPLAGSPEAVAFDPQNGFVYVALASNNSVVVINSTNDAIVKTIRTGTSPDALAFDAPRELLYVANNRSNNVSVINTTSDTVVQTVPVGTGPVGLYFAAGSGEVYVADHGSKQLSVIDDSTNFVSRTIPLGAGPDALTGNPTLQAVFVTNSSTNSLEIVNALAGSVSGSLTIGQSPAGLAYDPSVGEVVVAEFNSDNLTILDGSGRSSSGSIQLGLTPSAAAFDPHSNELGVVFSDQNSLWLLNASTDQRIASIPVGVDPVAIVYDSINQCFYVSSPGSNLVAVVNGTTNQRVTTIPDANGPGGIAFAAAFNEIFVNNMALTGPGPNFTLTKIDPQLNQATGTIQLNAGSGGSYFLSPSGIAFDAANGDLYVGVSGVLAVVNARNGTSVATIPMGVQAQSIAIDPSGNAVFAVSGLPTAFSLGGAFGFLTVLNAITHTILSNTTVGIAPGGVVFDAQNGLVYVSNLGTDNVSVVDPSNLTRPVVLGALSVGTFPIGLADNGAGGQVAVVNEYSPSLSIITLPGLGTFPVNITELGLRAGQSWTVTLGGNSYSSTAPSIVVAEPDGTFSFRIAAAAGYSAIPSSGNVTVAGAFVDLAVSFAPIPPTYSVQFSEVGLPSGTNWSVDWNHTLIGSAQSTITIASPNGTVAWSIPVVVGYSVNRTDGSTVVAGHPVVVSLNFTSDLVGGPSATARPPSLGPFEGYLVAGAAAAVGALVGVLVGRGRGRGPVRGGSPESAPAE